MKERRYIKNPYDVFKISIIVLIILRVWLALDIPLKPWGPADVDDFLMFSYAQTLAAGKWLGEYGYYTFLKGMTYPLFIALCFKLNIPYTLGLIGLYAFSCYVFVKALSPIVKNKYISGIIFILLLYSPVMFTDVYTQRLYRNAIVPAFVLLVIGFQMGIYLRLGDGFKKVLLWTIYESIALAFFWYIREDSLWLLPFSVVSAIIICIRLRLMRADTDIKGIRKIIFAMPLAAVTLFSLLIAGINYDLYGVPANVELRLYMPDPYNTFIGHLEDIEPDKELKDIVVTRNAIDQACAVSPTLNDVKPDIDKVYNEHWNNTWGNSQIEGEISGSYYWWAIRLALKNAGIYDDSETTYSFLENVNKELEAAFDDGRLKAIEDNGFFDNIINDREVIIRKILKSFKFMIDYKLCGANQTTAMPGAKEQTRIMEVMTGGRVINTGSIKAHGYISLYDGSNSIRAELADENGKPLEDEFDRRKEVTLRPVDPSEGDMPGEVCYEFDIDAQDRCYIFEKASILIYMNDVVYNAVTINNGGNIYQDDKLVLKADKVEVVADVFVHDGEASVNFANAIVKIYHNLSWIVFAAAVLGYIYICIRAAKEIKIGECEFITDFIFTTGFILCNFVLIFIVCYTYRNASTSITKWISYLPASYSLMQMFKYYTIAVCLKEILNKKFKLKREK